MSQTIHFLGHRTRPAAEPVPLTLPPLSAAQRHEYRARLADLRERAAGADTTIADMLRGMAALTADMTNDYQGELIGLVVKEGAK